MEYFETANIIARGEKCLTIGCRKFDNLLKGGIPCRGITQFYGEGGSGKTQLALQLCLTVQLPIDQGGLSSGAVYICTGSFFPSRRFQQLIEELNAIKNYGINGDAVFVEHIATIDELETCLVKKIPMLMNARKIGLIVLDSIAALFRVEDWQDAGCSRAKSLRAIGRQLHKLSKNGETCVLCINQVTAVLNNNFCWDESPELPALGLTWGSMVTTSIQFYRGAAFRYACVKLSSNLPEISIPFLIERSGIVAR